METHLRGELHVKAIFWPAGNEKKGAINLKGLTSQQIRFIRP